MLRFFFKKRIIRKQKKKLVINYLRLKKFLIKKNFINNYKSIVFITLPKRQQFFTFININTSKIKCFSVGRFLISMGRKSKFFKRNPKNIMSIILQFKKIYGVFLKYIYMFVINNFNYRQFSFFKKFNEIITPNIYYFIHRNSFMPKFLNKKSIKRRVLRKLKSI